MSLLPENFDWLGWPLLAVGLIMLAIAFHEWVFKRLKWHFYPAWHVSLDNISPFKILIPLEDATRITYEKLRNTAFGNTVERMNPQETEPARDC